MIAIILTHAEDWTTVVGPFDDEATALKWIENHSVILEDASTKLVEMSSPPLP